MRNLVAVMKGVFVACGSSLELGDLLMDWLIAEGFEEVYDRIINTKLGSANPNSKLAKQGVYSTTVAARSLANFGKSESTLSTATFMA